jgi:hypothetical protein
MKAEEYIYNRTGYEVDEENMNFDSDLSWDKTITLMNEFSSQKLLDFKRKLKKAARDGDEAKTNLIFIDGLFELIDTL